MNRGMMLFSQGRYEMAAEEFRQMIAQEPDDAFAHCFLSLSLLEMKKFDAAQAAADRARLLEPSDALPHFVMSRVLRERNHQKEALESIHLAIQIDPEDRDNYILRAWIYMDLQKRNEALADCEQALKFDPDDADARNLRAAILRQLGREAEANSDIEDLLSRNPEDSLTHANRGWSLLEQGRPQDAQVHFQEALRLDPTNEYARDGYINCLKSRSYLYAILLRIMLWMGRVSTRYGIKGMLVFVAAFYLFGELGRASPALGVYILPLKEAIFVLLVLAFSSQHIFNLLLRMDAYGRQVLNDEERFQSTLVGGWFFLTGVMAYPHLFTGSRLWAPFAPMMLGMLMILVIVFRCPQGWPRRWMAGAFGVLVLSLAAFLAETLYIRNFAFSTNLAIPAPKSPIPQLEMLSAELQKLLDLLAFRVKHYTYHYYGMMAALVAALYLEDVKVKQ